MSERSPARSEARATSGPRTLTRDYRVTFTSRLWTLDAEWPHKT